MQAQETDLIHFSLTLTSIMKRSFQKKGEDIFKIENLDIKQLNVYGTSISTLNMLYFKEILIYVYKLQHELEKYKDRDITYLEIRNALRKRKTNTILKLKGDEIWNRC